MSYFPYKQDSAGSVLVSQEGGKATYRANFQNIVGISGVVASVFGSASKTIKITKILLAISTSGSVTQGTVFFNKYLAALSAGTSAAVTPTPLDSADAGASAVAKLWTAAPTEPSAANILPIHSYVALTQTTTIPGNDKVLDFGGVGAKPLVLRGVSEGFAVKLGAPFAAAGVVVNLTVEWTEE